MPFHQRTVEPRRVSRISARDGRRAAGENGRRRLRRPVLFSELDEVSCHTLTGMIHQLSDLSRHASDIFLGIEMEAGLVFQRTCRIQGRLRNLQEGIHKLDHKTIKIREFCCDFGDPLCVTCSMAVISSNTLSLQLGLPAFHHNGRVKIVLGQT